MEELIHFCGLKGLGREEKKSSDHDSFFISQLEGWDNP